MFIIWRSWGLLSFFAIVIGLVVGFWLGPMLGDTQKGAQTGAISLGIAAVLNLVLALWVYPVTDKPRPQVIVRPLSEPRIDENGKKRYSVTEPLLDENGEQVMAGKRSSLFFIPGRFVWIPLAVIAIVLAFV